MRLRKKYRIRLIAILSLAMFLPSMTKSQVTIGDKVAPQPFSLLEITAAKQKGGVRLPQLTTAERNALNPSSNAKEGKGLVIYNIDNNCIEYWNLTKWESLCRGNANIVFTNPGGDPDNPADLVDPTQPPFLPEGETKGPFVPHDKPECTTQTPPYTLSVMSGSEYTRIIVTNEATGEFKITMDANPSIKTRTAIVRVTNNCTGEYKEFLFTQSGLDENVVCDPNKTVPAISGWNGTDICNGGAAYLYLSGVSATAPDINDYIWTCDGQEVGRGASYIAEKSGTYVVYYKTIGCPQNSGSLTVNAENTNQAPGKINTLVAENDGYVCNPGDKVKLVADVSNLQSGETIIWFKDNVRQLALDGQSTILAGTGVWYCAVIKGGCSSLPSESKTVHLDPNAGKGGATIVKPNVTVNGTPLASATLCRGGVVILTVTNPQPGVDYIWKLDNTVIGTGISFSYLIPSNLSGTKVIRCTATSQLNNTCRVEAFDEKTVSTGSIPATPYITVNTKDALCGGSATLTANFAGTPAAYNWYRKEGADLIFITSTGTNPNYTITQAGEYAVSVTSGDCSSAISGSKAIVASDFGTISWILKPETANVGDTKTYSVQVTPDYKVAYFWTVVGGTITNGQGTNSITVNFPTATNAIVFLIAENACGTVSGTNHVNVTVTAACTPPSVVQNTGTNQTLTAGSVANMSVTAAGTQPFAYQWYSGTVGTTTNPISGETSSSYAPVLSNTGTHTYWCKVSNSCGNANSAQFTIVVEVNPATLPLGAGTFSGRTCFDVVETNSGGDCGTLNSRMSQKANFTQIATNTQTYTFTTSGTVSNIRFYAVDQTEPVIESITPESSTWATGKNLNGTFNVTVKYKTDLNTTAAGRDRSNALTAMLYVVYNDNANGNGIDKRLELKVSVQDCSCCIGYLAEGKEYVQKIPGYLNSFADGSNFATVVTYFTATGKDICFYKSAQSNAASLLNARSSCNGLKDLSGDSGWRLPTIAELGSIQSVATKLSSQPTSISGTVDMANSPQSGQSAYYWSDTERNGSVTWGWNYYYGTTQPISVSNRVRCVKTQ